MLLLRLLVSLLLSVKILAFVIQQPHSKSHIETKLYSIAVPSWKLDENLTTAERSVISVVRSCSPSVAFVTSVLPHDNTLGSQQRRRRRPVTSTPNSSLPRGQGLGSGSGFVIEADGYVVTNYHVIERAYQIIQTQQQTMQRMTDLIANATEQCQWIGTVATATLQRVPPVPLPDVFVRINSASQYQLCRIVDVKPDLDVAVLKIVNNTERWSTIDFGSSGMLLVGQSLVAIGNPFGLDQTVTTGVVSALDREISTSISGKIRNCIQTDASINPGNSGGPLLNLNNQVIGMNTAIVTTSGSSAGIGFAVPSDKIQPVVRDMIRKDKAEQGLRPKMGFLGITIIKGKPGNWIDSVANGSPAFKAGLQGIQTTSDGMLTFGDSILAIGGNAVDTFDDLERELQTRVRDEEITITVNDATGERRILYVKLGSKQ